MKNLSEIKAEKEKKVSALINDCLMFFAFSNEQFTENKTALQEGEKYVSLGAGAYMPKGSIDKWSNGMDEINTWYKASIKSNRKRKENILYELNNHEAFYTNDIEDTWLALGSDYTLNEVMEVFRSECKKQLRKEYN